jgi:uncharacterized membrane protein (UPF0127 family)
MIYRIRLAAGVVAVALVVALALFQAQRSFADGRAMILPVDPAPLVVVTSGGERSFDIEIADDAAERSAGLMYREDMADNHGMLFVFPQTRDVAFWMKNTPMPLDLIFIGEDGRVGAVMRGEPQSQAIIAPAEPARFVLELKAGTAARERVETGDLVKHPAISAVNGG